MANTATITNITKYADGRIWVEFGAEGQIFESLADLKLYVNQMQTMDAARVFLVGWWLARQTAGNNTNLVIGKKMTLDMSAQNPITVK